MVHPHATRILRAVLAVALIATFAAELLPARQASAAATLVRMSASGSATGGKRVHIRVVISEPAPRGGINIPLTSNNPAIPVPDYAHVNTGETEELVGITTVPVTDTVDVTVTATYKGVAKQKIVTIKEPFHSSLSLQSVIRAGGLGKVVVRLSGRAPAGGITVNLSTTEPDVFKLPTTAHIEPGDASAILRVDATDQPGDVPISVTSLYPKLGDTYTKHAIVRHYSSPTPTDTPTNTPPTDVPPITPTYTSTAESTATFTPTATSTPDPSDPTLVFTVLSPVFENGKYYVASGGSATVQVCMTVAPAGPYPVTFTLNSPSLPRAEITSGSPFTFTNVNDCTDVVISDLVYPTDSYVQLIARLGTREIVGARSPFVIFQGEPAETVTATSTTVPVETATATNTSIPTETATNTPVPTETATNTPVPAP